MAHSINTADRAEDNRDYLSEDETTDPTPKTATGEIKKIPSKETTLKEKAWSAENTEKLINLWREKEELFLVKVNLVCTWAYQSNKAF